MAQADGDLICYRDIRCSNNKDVSVKRYEECLAEEVLPELLLQKFTAAIIQLDIAVIVDENCRVTVAGLSSGNLILWKTELSQKKTVSFSLLFDTPISVARFGWVHPLPVNGITLAINHSSVNSEVFLVTSCALGPVKIYSEVDIITGKLR